MLFNLLSILQINILIKLQIIWMISRTEEFIAYGDQLSDNYAEYFQLVVDEYSSTLIILSADYYDADMYICMLENQRIEFNLTIKGK